MKPAAEAVAWLWTGFGQWTEGRLTWHICYTARTSRFTDKNEKSPPHIVDLMRNASHLENKRECRIKKIVKSTPSTLEEVASSLSATPPVLEERKPNSSQEENSGSQKTKMKKRMLSKPLIFIRKKTFTNIVKNIVLIGLKILPPYPFKSYLQWWECQCQEVLWNKEKYVEKWWLNRPCHMLHASITSRAELCGYLNQSLLCAPAPSNTADWERKKYGVKLSNMKNKVCTHTSSWG